MYGSIQSLFLYFGYFLFTHLMHAFHRFLLICLALIDAICFVRFFIIFDHSVIFYLPYEIIRLFV